MNIKTYRCKDCGHIGEAAKKGAPRVRCKPCAARRHLQIARDNERAKNGLPPRPSTVTCESCSASVSVKPKGPIPIRCQTCAWRHHIQRCNQRIKNSPHLAKQYKRASYERHGDKYRAYGRKQAGEYYRQNRERVLEKLRNRTEEEKAAHAKKQRIRRQRDPAAAREKSCRRYRENIQYRIACVLRARIRPLMAGRKPAGSCVRDLGVSVKEFRSYIESQFYGDMSWQNYGTAWELDHIYPLSACDLTDRVQFLAVCNYRNYRPLPPAENMSKHARVYEDARALFSELLSDAEKKVTAEGNRNRQPSGAGRRRIEASGAVL